MTGREAVHEQLDALQRRANTYAFFAGASFSIALATLLWSFRLGISWQLYCVVAGQGAIMIVFQVLSILTSKRALRLRKRLDSIPA